MKIGFQCKVTVVGKSVNDFDKSDGTGKAQYYKVAIIQDGQCANVSCSEDVYNEVLLDPQMPIDIDVFMIGSFDDSSKRFRFDKVVRPEHVKNVSK